MDVQIERPPSFVNVGKAERGVSIAAGLAMISYLLTRRPSIKMGLPVGLEAGYMLYRGATGHCLIYQAMEINRSGAGNKGIQAQRSVTVNLPREQLYRIWRNFENLPRFMKHLQRVDAEEASSGKQSHWVAKAPFGREIEWDAEITEELENETLAWRSLPGSIVESMGRVQFSDAAAGRGTILSVSMQYNPPAGSMGAAVARLFGEEPGQQLRDDLRHFKQMMEAGEIPSVEGQPSGRNHNFERSIAQRRRERDLVEEASAQSFPASDPPAWISGKKGKRRVTS
ncbi:MAG TPA: SRPBCC family protein [Anaerolineales bacterium]|nr:SRPBCC family protein [Anaerolineales bacterium]